MTIVTIARTDLIWLTVGGAENDGRENDGPSIKAGHEIYEHENAGQT